MKAYLQQWADLRLQVRQFFAARQVMEVSSQVLAPYTVTDPYMDSIEATVQGQRLYLQTSPEYAMKRFLAAGSSDIYQIAPAFRDEVSGRHHHFEFTMLEWYRVGMNHHQLMDEVSQLLSHVLKTTSDIRISYRDLFLQHLNFDPHHIDLDTLRKFLAKYGVYVTDPNELSATDCLQLLLSHCIEEKLGFEAPCFIYDYPEAQAALAIVQSGDPPVAERFEVYINGIELANGFHELCDPIVQKQRFIKDQQQRQQEGRNVPEIDTFFVEALADLPPCAGVAMGLDRLLMIKRGAKKINA